MRRCDRTQRIGVIIVIVLAMAGPYYGAGWMKGDATREKYYIAISISYLTEW